MNKMLRKIVSFNQIFKTTTNSYSKNTKTARKKIPHETTTATAKWVPNRKVAIIEETKMDKNFLQRQIVDPVWLMKEYKPQVLKIEDAIKYHIEMAQESMLNNMDGYLHARIILDMTTKKKAKFLDNIKGAISFPNHFEDGIPKEVIAICKNEAEIEAAKNAGALHAGFTDIIKKFEKGEIADQSYDFLVCTPEVFADVMLIKKKINKDKLPALRSNTVTENIGETVARFHRSKDYESAKSSDEQGILKLKLGKLSMGVEKLTDNLGAAVDKIKMHKKYAMETFMSDCVLFAPPSTEKFKVDLTRFTVAPVEDDKEDENELKQAN